MDDAPEELNLTPYLDVLMNLIVFALISSAGLVTWGVVPASVSPGSPLPGATSVPLVHVSDETLSLNGLTVTLDELPAKLAPLGGRRLNPDILVLDIRMPEMNGLEAAAKLEDYSPDTKAVILSMHDSEEYVLQALDAGAFGYLLKDTDKAEFVKALKQIYGGSKYFSGAVSNVLANRLLNPKPFTTTKAVEVDDTYHLTRREKEILRMVVEGKHNKQIAEASGKSVRTIETHRFNIMKKLSVNNAIDMVNKAMKENLV